MEKNKCDSAQSDTITDASLSKILLGYQHFRFNRPHLYTSMRKSVKRYGQITPVVVIRSYTTHGSYDLLDGFKRYHALHDLGKESIRIHIVTLGIHASKAAIINFNKAYGSVSALEESLIVRSLYREDKLNQVEIGVLFGKDKSWVCRRISLCENLIDEVIEHLRLGLICMSIARELTRLPRGNQLKALECIVKHRLSSRETHKLVSHLLTSPHWEHANFLWLPYSILEGREPPRDTKKTKDSLTQLLSSLERIVTISFENCFQAISGKMDLFPLLEEKITATIHHLTGLQTRLKESLSNADTIHTQP
jgi:ParB/RepB/Spo0J family partition protein